jgi:hypothetical protein
VDPCQEVGLKYGTITKQRTDKFGVGFLLTQPALPAARRSLPAPPPAPSCSLQIRLGFGLEMPH